MATMFRRAERATSAAPGWLASLGERSDGFSLDPRYLIDPSAPATNEIPAPDAAELAAAETQRAVRDAFEAGLARGRGEAVATVAAERAAHEKLQLSLQRLDETLRRKFADRLVETVTSLCEAAMLPFALEKEALARRCERAAALLGAEQAKLELHLHPDDVASLDPDFAAGWKIVPEAAFQRGTVRIDNADGASVIDGPAEWRTALESAFKC